MYGSRGLYQKPLTELPPNEPDTETITGFDSGTGSTQPQGQTNETPEPFDWDVLLGQVWRASGSASTQAQAVTDAKAKIAGMEAGSYGIVVRQGGATVYTENVEAGSGQQQQGEGGGAEGGGGGGGGGSSEGGGGSGQPGDMGFRYRLTGYKWTWDDKTAEDPRSWKGHGAEYDISATDYTYGSAQDALDAGKAVGSSDTAVMRVFAESNYPSQFAGLQFTYSDRLTAATNAGAKEADDAYNEYIKTGDLDLPEPPGPDIDVQIPQEAIVAMIIVIVVVAMIAVVMSLGASQ